MALADVDKVDFEVKVTGVLAALGGESQLTITPLHYTRTNFGVAFVASAMLTAFHAAVKADWKAAASLSWSWTKTSIRCINDPTEPEVEAVVGEVGGVAGDMCPSYVAAVLTKKSALRGQRFNGRMYFPGIPESGTTGNAVTNGELALLNALGVDLSGIITDANGVTFVPGVLSRENSELVTPPIVVGITPIVSVYAKQVLGRLLSRKSIVQ